jgi:hypothetical protein
MWSDKDHRRMNVAPPWWLIRRAPSLTRIQIEMRSPLRT